MERHIFLLLSFAGFVTALRHSKYNPEKKGNTEFPCRLPCPWRGKTFDLYDVDGGISFLNWTVDASGKSGEFPNGITFECHQITDRFLIYRIGGSDDFFCSAISYDGSRHPMTFSLHDSTIITFENKTDKFSDICEVCSYPSSLKLLFVESGAPRPDNASIPCNLPSACECCQTCTSCVHCETENNPLYGEFMVIEKQKDVIYTGHVAFEIFTIPMWSLCAQLCTRLTICKSINFISLTKTCQINIAEPNCPTSCLSNSVGDSFIAASALPKELAGICEGHACNITEICVPRSQSEGYICHPLIGYRLEPPKVHIPQSFYEVIVGQSVTLACTVTSYLPITHLTWTKNVSSSVSTIDSGDSTHLYDGGVVGTPSLTLLSVTQNDVGTYICSSTNIIDTRSSNAITVSLHLPPNVQILNSSYEVTFGKSVTLVCMVTSRLPLTSLSWEKNIGGSVSMIDPDNGDGIYGGGNVESPSLIIFNVTANDTGTYICSASNLVGTISSDIISLVINLPPRVHIPQSSYDGIFGQSVTLVCMVTSQLPLTDVTWTKQNNDYVSTIDPDDSGSFYRDGDVQSPSLIILNVTQNDTGTYVCSASNKVDTRSSDTITLIVHSVPTVFVHQLSYTATFGSTVTLDCTVSSTTSATITDVYWQKTNDCKTKNISSSTTPAKYSGGTVNTPSLTIVNTDGLDVSSFTCFASNIAGTGQSSASFLNVSAADVPRDCSALHPLSVSGVYRIHPTASVNFDVYCDMDTLCGGWTVFQKRFDGTYDFYKVWNDYKTGFGNLNAEFWLGNDYLNYITSSGEYRLYVDLEAYDGSTAYAEYAIFRVGNSLSNYILNVSGYLGNAGDSLDWHNGMKFSTKDRDNDNADWDCAVGFISSWWNNACISSNLNGRYGIGVDKKGIVWRGFKDWNSLKASKMMMKRHY